MSESVPTFPSEEYIAGRERGRMAGLKGILKVRIRRIVVGFSLGGAFAGIMLASPATTGRSSFAPSIALPIFSLFIVLGGLGCLKAVLSFRRSTRHLRDDIVRSVMKPDDATPEPGRLRKWWLRGDSYGGNPWEAAAMDGANDGRRKH
jgi:hypothetical protein